MLKDKIYGVRDPFGNRPLCIGKIMPIDLGESKWSSTCYYYLKTNIYLFKETKKQLLQMAGLYLVKVVDSYQLVPDMFEKYN